MKLREIDKSITHWLGHYGIIALRFSFAIIFIWFGFLKVISYSPAIELVTQTVYWFNPVWFVPFLGWWEMVIGACFLYRPLIRVGILLLIPQMIGTFLPLVLLPEITFQSGSFLLPTLEGQYILKNLIIIAGAMAIGATVRQRHEGF